MKLTWFGGTTLRIHIGGEVLVCGAPAEAEGIRAAELASGLDRVFALSDAFAAIDPALWRPRRATPLQDSGPAPVAIHRVGADSVLVEAVGEPPLLLLAEALDIRARWTGDAVALVFDPRLAEGVLDTMHPRLIAIAADASDDGGGPFEHLADRLAGTGLVALEKGMGLEV